jgi:hypothetical protein
VLEVVSHRNGGFENLNVLERNNVVAGLYICDTLTDGLDDTGTLVTKDNGEGTLGVLSGKCVCICRTLVCRSMLGLSSAAYLLGCRLATRRAARRTGMADTGVVDLNADLVGLRWSNLDILNGEVLASFPGDCCLYLCQLQVSLEVLASLSSLLSRVKSQSRELRHPCYARNACVSAGPHAKAAFGDEMFGWELEEGAVLRFR